MDKVGSEGDEARAMMREIRTLSLKPGGHLGDFGVNSGGSSRGIFGSNSGNSGGDTGGHFGDSRVHLRGNLGGNSGGNKGAHSRGNFGNFGNFGDFGDFGVNSSGDPMQSSQVSFTREMERSSRESKIDLISVSDRMNISKDDYRDGDDSYDNNNNNINNNSNNNNNNNNNNMHSQYNDEEHSEEYEEEHSEEYDAARVEGNLSMSISGSEGGRDLGLNDSGFGSP